MKDSIVINEINAFSKIGLYDFERELGQNLVINLELETDLSKAAKSNAIEDTVDYTKVSVKVREIAQKKEYLLVENLAEEIVLELFNSFKLIEAIKLELHKTIINAEKFSGKIAIRIYRQRQ